MINRREFLSASLFATFSTFVPTLRANVLPWLNWSGALRAEPKQRVSPASEQELIEQIKTLTGSIRPVGAGHSFSPLVPTNDNLLVLDRLAGLIKQNDEQKTAVLAAGTRLSDAGFLLDGIGQAMFNLPDIDRQTLAGAIATSTHGTGLNLRSLSGYVNYLRLVTPNGKVVELDESREEFLAARVNLGALGVVTQIGFQNRGLFRLKTKSWVEETSSVINTFDARCLEYEHYEFLPFPHADYSLVIAHQETNEEEVAPAPAEDSGDLFDLLNKVPVMMRPFIFNQLLGAIPETSSVEASHLALTNIRNDRFNEMEYSVPVDVGLECVAAVLDTIKKESIDVVFPLEYRVIAEDDSWLSMFQGGARASISIHRSAGLDYKPYFDRIEKVFWEFGGRPHWGKLHSLGYNELSKLYSNFDEFIAIQKAFDPKGQMLNEHLAYLFGLDGANR